MLVTTSFHPHAEQKEEARHLARRLGVPYVDRERFPLAELMERNGADSAVVVTREGWHWEDREGRQFFFHPNMSVPRIKQLRQGNPDPLVTVSGMQPGDRVLDCTLGMGADAVVSAFVTGQTVTGLESQPVIAELVSHGLKTYPAKNEELKKAMRSIEVVCTDYREFLPQCAKRSYDIILFDPMFRETVRASSGVQPLRLLANMDPLDPETVRHAVRVARKAVVLKERPQSGEFERLGFDIVKQSARFALGVIRVEGGRG